MQTALQQSAQPTAAATATPTAPAIAPVAPVAAPNGVPAAASAMPRPAVPAPAADQAQPLPNVTSVTATRRPWLAIFAIFSVFASLVGTFIIYSWNTSTKQQIVAVESEIDDLKQQLASPPYSDIEKQVNLIETSLQGYKAALAKQVDYTSFIDNITTITPKDVSLDALTLDEKGAVKISGITQSFESAGKAHLAFQTSPYLQNVILDTVGMSETDKQVMFGLSATLRKDRLMPDAPIATTDPAVPTTTGDSPAGIDPAQP